MKSRRRYVTYGEKPKRRKLSRLKRFALVLLVVLFAIALTLFSAIRSVSPVIVALSEARVRSLVTSAVNTAIFTVMTEGVSYDDLISMSKDEATDVIHLTSKSLAINKLANETAKTSEKLIGTIGRQGIDIPVGTLMGTPLLAGQGFLITIIVEPVGSVKCNFISEFEEAGINQTRHKIFLEVLTEIDIIIPTADTTITTSTQVLVAESILIGAVPQTYLNFETGAINN